MAEQEGFEPSSRFSGYTISNRARYDHFDTAPNGHKRKSDSVVSRLFDYTSFFANVKHDFLRFSHVIADLHPPLNFSARALDKSIPFGYNNLDRSTTE